MSCQGEIQGTDTPHHTHKSVKKKTNDRLWRGLKKLGSPGDFVTTQCTYCTISWEINLPPEQTEGLRAMCCLYIRW